MNGGGEIIWEKWQISKTSMKHMLEKGVIWGRLGGSIYQTVGQQLLANQQTYLLGAHCMQALC